MKIPNDLSSKLATQPRKLHIEEWCQGCGSCIEKCGADALELIGEKIQINKERCRLCGYCGSACPLFAIKVI